MAPRRTRTRKTLRHHASVAGPHVSCPSHASRPLALKGRDYRTKCKRAQNIKIILLVPSMFPYILGMEPRHPQTTLRQRLADLLQLIVTAPLRLLLTLPLLLHVYRSLALLDRIFTAWRNGTLPAPLQLQATRRPAPAPARRQRSTPRPRIRARRATTPRAAACPATPGFPTPRAIPAPQPRINAPPPPRPARCPPGRSHAPDAKSRPKCSDIATKNRLSNTTPAAPESRHASAGSPASAPPSPYPPPAADTPPPLAARTAAASHR